MPSAEARLRFRADEEHAGVRVQVALVEEVTHDDVGGLVEGRQVVPLVPPELATDPVFLQREREHLLGNDVPGLRRRHDLLYPALSPEVKQSGRLEESVAVECQEEAVPGSTGTPPGPADPL